MTDVLAGTGLEPAPEVPDEPGVAPVEPEPTEPVAEPAEPEIVVPEGAENPDAVKAAIKAERTKARDANARARDLERQLRERDEADKPLEERVTSADARAAQADLKVVRLEVALEKGLTIKQAARLIGTTKQELEDDADELVSDLGVTPAKPNLDGGYKKDPPKPKDPARDHGAFLAAVIGAKNQG